MSEPMGTLTPLSDTDQVVADPEQDVRGRDVVDSAGEKVGTVADLLIDTAANQVRFLQVEHGGIFGFGAVSSFIPVSAVRSVDRERVHVDSDKEHIAGAPGYHPDLVPEHYYSQVYDHYGHEPHWSAGYTQGGFPTGPGIPPPH